MIFWSVVPLEQVLAGYDDPASAPQLHVMRVQGVDMLVEPLSPWSVKVHRLLSPRPSDYLDPRFAPGQVIEWHWD